MANGKVHFDPEVFRQTASETGIRMGHTMMGGALANLLDNPDIAKATIEAGESTVERLKDLWARDVAQKFDQQYGENVRARKEQIISQYEQDMRIFQIPFNEEEQAQAADPDAAPVIPREGYRVVDPVTGETSYIEANTPEAVSYYREKTENYFSGLNQLVSEYLDAAAQYPKNPYIQQRASSLMESITGQIAGMREADAMARNRMDQRLKEEELADREAAREEKGITDEAKVDHGYTVLAEQNGISKEAAKERFTERQARVAGASAKARQDYITKQRDLEEEGAERQAKIEQGVAHALETDPSAVAGWDLSEPESQKEALKWYFKYQEAVKIAERERKRLREGKSLNKIRSEIPPDLVPSIVEEDKGIESRLVYKASQYNERERKPKLDAEIAKRVNASTLVTPEIITKVKSVGKYDDTGRFVGADLMSRPEYVRRSTENLHIKDAYDEAVMLLLDAEETVPGIDKEKTLTQITSDLMEESIRQSPDWVKKHVTDAGFSSVEEFLGTKWPERFPKYVPKDVEKPVSKDNNMEDVLAVDPADPYDEEKGKDYINLEQFVGEMEEVVSLASASRPRPEEVQAAVELSNTEVSRLIPPESQQYQYAKGVIGKERDSLRRILTVMSQEMALLSQTLNPEDLAQASEMYRDSMNSVVADIKILDKAYEELATKQEKAEQIRSKAAYKGKKSETAKRVEDFIGGPVKETGKSILEYRGLFPERIERSGR